MRLLARSLAVSGVVLLASAGIASAQSPARCTNDSLTVDGTPIAVTLCVPAQPGSPVVVTETFTRGTQRFDRTLDLDIVSGAPVTRTIDDVPLTDFGSSKELHLTIAYRGGEANLEHALLLPGAVVLK